MEHRQFRTRAQLERQMQAARQLRADTMARGFRGALESLSAVVRRMVDRRRGAEGLSAQSWLLAGSQQRPSRR
jgi:hypothetical protein